MKIGGVLAVYGPSRGLMLKTYSSAIENLNKKGFEVTARFENFLDEDAPPGVPQALMEWFEKEADAILISFPPDYEGVFADMEELKKRTSKPIIPLSPMCAALGTVSPRHLKVFWDYQNYGGPENIENLLLYAGKLAGKNNQEVNPPVEVPSSGIYHPDAGEIFTDLESYLEWYSENGKSMFKTVGLLFPNLYYMEDSPGVFDALIRKLEEKNFGVIAAIQDKWSPGGSSDEIIRKYFMNDGKVLVDAAVIYAAFFLNLKGGKGRSIGQEKTNILKELNVPCLKMIHSSQTPEEWKANPEGLSIPQIIISVALPEFDGLAEPIIIGTAEKKLDPVTGAEVQDPVPIDDQIDFLIRRVGKWIELGRKPNSEKKVAIILHNSPCKSGVEATVGAGFGLDTLESVSIILKRLKEEGYFLNWVPENGKELIDTILEKKAISEFRWTPLSEIIKHGGAAGFVPLETYKEWLYELPEDARNKVFEGWGNPFEQGIEKLERVDKLSLALHENSITIPGLDLGNVFIGLQPKRGCAGARCDGTVCKILHDPDITPPHQYLAYYKWIEKEFGADVMVHVGTHGNIELLPGKTVAQSSSCFSQICVGSMPHLYIYVSSNPMEGSIAKRRGLSVIVDHLHPVMAAAETYGVLEELEEPLEEYKRAMLTKDLGRARVLQEIIAEKAAAANFPRSISDFETFEDYMEYLHGQMDMVRETMIRDGLHILGQAPEGEALVDMLVSILRFDQGNAPSIRRGILEAIGLDYDSILDDPTAFIREFGMTGSKLLDTCTEIARGIMTGVLERDLISDEEIFEISKWEMSVATGQSLEFHSPGLEKIVKSVRLAEDLLPEINRTPDEVNNLLRGFNAEHVEAGASGALARGKIEILPTGRNFYAIDPWKIPTPAAWKVGVKLAENFFRKYLHENEGYPENVGFVFRFFDTFRADGELLSQILYTLGVRVEWDGSRVKGLKVIPLNELKRPRIDCTIQLSSMLRDGMPRAFELVDEAVSMVAFLDEPEEMNFVKKHALERMKELEAEGTDTKLSPERLATLRVFTTQPGTYDYGVNTAVAASAWETDEDLASIFTKFCGYAYGKGVYGQAARNELESNLKRITVTYDKWDSDEYDILECCHIYGSHGGFTVAARTLSKNNVDVYFADTHDPERPRIRDMKDELERIARTRLLNPKWIEGKKRHGYKGTTVISDRVYHMYGWQATTKLVGDWVFDEIAETFVLDDEMRKWFEENNLYALESLARRLLEAEHRKLWNADPETLEELKEKYLEIESRMEEKMSDIEGEFQGGVTSIVKVNANERI
ncbi:CobN component of cobalt chelatase involved in B12 biosynthesis [Methanosarcina siciliae C2J]|uniref:CobN component of cobalt chelatase involved in B12 biosynthesis n=1 Tax=Methanosarcina siciliae C2J TaxID=1434118 RepID=A0A0E3PK69_9EURY|nr:cobaltochelatase subunit CobN [Methanosarcina siciliae]AKB35405.1 CobN component of cobalt chelatase involved in B12 biosynthesis [Methanosarcina siciliae C2J]